MSGDEKQQWSICLKHWEIWLHDKCYRCKILQLCCYQTNLSCRFEQCKWIWYRNFTLWFLSVSFTCMVVLDNLKCSICILLVFNPPMATEWHLKWSYPVMLLKLLFCWRVIKQVVHCLHNCINTPCFLLHNCSQISVYHMKTSWSSINQARLIITCIPLFYYAIIKFPASSGSSMEICTNFLWSRFYVPPPNFLFRSSARVWQWNAEMRCLLSTSHCLRSFTTKSICSSCHSCSSYLSKEITKHDVLSTLPWTF